MRRRANTAISANPRSSAFPFLYFLGVLGDLGGSKLP
jgi:hypothetical protein